MNCENCRNRCDCKSKEAFEALLKFADGGASASCSGYEPEATTDVADNKVGKMTVNEIIKALEHIEAFTCCENCAFYKKCNGKCVITATLDLINRLNAEIERLEEKNSNLTSDLTSLQNDLTSAKAEIERLKPFEDKIAEFKSHIRVEDMLVFASSLEEWLEFCDNLKAEAYKECIEKVKERLSTCVTDTQQMVFELRLDNLLNELVGENDA